MRDIDTVVCYEGDLPKPTKGNSIIIANRVISIIKKDYDCKASKVFSAYDYKSKRLLHSDFEKEDLVSFLVKESASIATVFKSSQEVLFV